jgi:DHA1 family tetracycline resistance protein-like MFS transporter
VKREAAISLFPVLTVNFLGTLGLSIVLPFMVFLVTRLGGNGLLYGVLSAAYPALQLVGAPVLGRWSDLYGRRRILLLSEAGTLAGWGLFIVGTLLPVTVLYRSEGGPLGAFAVTVPFLVLFLARAVDGLTGGNISVAYAYVADVTSEADRNRSFGRMAVSSNLGFVVGPALAGVIGATALGMTLPAMVAAGISFCAILMIALGLPESRPISTEEKKETVPLRRALERPYVAFMLVLYFLIYLGFNFFYTSFPVHVVRALHWDVRNTGNYFAVLSLLMVIVQGPVLSFLTGRVSNVALVLAGGAILGSSFVLLTIPSAAVYYAAAALFALGNGVMWPSFLAILSIASGEFQGTVQGFASSAGSAASIIGLLAGGLLYDVIGARVFLVAAGIIFLVTLLSARLRRVGRGQPLR